MRKTKKIKLPTYNCNVIIVITDKLKEEVNSLYKKLKSNEKFIDDAEGVVITFDIDNYYIILDTFYLSHNTIAHEVYHATVKVTEDRDITDEESQAWLVGYITQEMYKHIYKNELNIVK